MTVITKKRIINFLCDVFAIVSFLTAISCLILKIRTFRYIPIDNLNIIAAKSVFPRGDFDYFQLINLKNKSGLENIIKINTENNISNSVDHNNTTNEKSIEFSTAPEVDEEYHSADEKKYNVIEKHIGTGGEKCENFYVKNTTGQEINFNEFLKRNPDIHIKNTNEPQVLIMHTHTSESYLNKDQNFFYENFYPRSLDNNKNVTQVGKAIVETLTKNGINAVHSTVFHDSPSYNGSYSRAAQTIKKNLEEFPSIQVVIDIHRDSMGSKESGKIKPVFTYKDKKASQLMIISGCDPNNTMGFPNWEKNLVFALKLQKYCESMFPGITRPLNFSKVKYNENLTPGSLLIEIGSDVNTLQESMYTGTMLGEALSQLLNDIKNN